jgi:tRNA G46 methylase TrmB
MSAPLSSSQNTHPYFIEAENAAEMARLMHQDRLLTKSMGGVFPEPLDTSRIHSVLDVACGPGGWILDVARTNPDIEAPVLTLARP